MSSNFKNTKSRFGLKKIVILFLLISFFAGIFFSANARINAIKLDFVTGDLPHLNLFILENDIYKDNENDLSLLRAMMNVEPLLVRRSFPQSFQVDTYIINNNGEKKVLNSLNHTVVRQNRAKIRFSIELPAVTGVQELYFDVFDSDNKLRNTYRQTVNFENINKDISEIKKIDAAVCDEVEFGECHLDYVVENLNFVLSEKNTNYSSKVKNLDGSYDVALSIPKSLKEQIEKDKSDLVQVIKDDLKSKDFIFEIDANFTNTNIDWSLANNYRLNIKTDTELNFAVNPIENAFLVLILKQDKVGNHNTKFPDNMKWPNDFDINKIVRATDSVNIIDCIFEKDSNQYFCNLRASY